ncbi:MAG: aromatic amino acid lyase, partial [Phycisphaerales bacterium]|nr:aromatic amino acid lyase [Phycisphaerales bacterium]
VVNITTCAGMEDYNSFGPRAAAKAARSIELAQYVVAVEMMCAAQGLDVHRPLRSGRGVEAALKIVRSYVKPLTDDRPLTADIHALAAAIADRAFYKPLGAAPDKAPVKESPKRSR